MINAIIFDFRDTLLRVDKAYRAANLFLWQFAREHEIYLTRRDFDKRLEKIIEDTKREFNGNPSIHSLNTIFLNRFFNTLHLKMSKPAFNRFIEGYDTVFAKHATLYPDALAILRYLRQNKIPCGLVIDGAVKREKTVIRLLGLDSYFKVIVISQMVGKNKYTTIPLQSALKKLHVMPVETLVVGDRIDKDIVHANSLGCVSVKLERHRGRYTNVKALHLKEKPKYMIRNLKELLPFITDNKAI